MPRSLKLFCVWLMTLILTNLPQLAAAEGIANLVPTSQVVNELSRVQVESDVKELLNKDEVKNQLVKNGITPEEASLRVASLSDQELRQFHGQLMEARAGGDILVTILLVVLIIFLIKRI